MAFHYKFIFDKNKTAKKTTDKAPIQIRFTNQRKINYLSTDIRIIEKHWEQDKQRVNSKNHHWMDLNLILEQYQYKLDKYHNDCLKLNQTPLFEEIKNLIKGSAKEKNTPTDFIEFIKSKIDTRIDITQTTKVAHRSKLNIIKEYAGSSLLFTEINLNWVIEFDKHLHGKGNSVNTRGAIHKVVKSYLNQAIKLDIIELNDYPYRNFTIKTEETNRIALTTKELKQIEQYTAQSRHEQIILDKFLFSCYTALRFSDQNTVKKSSFNWVAKNKCYLTFKMQKTRTTVKDLPLHELFEGKPMAIARKYMIEHDSEMLFPSRTGNYTRRVLKEIATHLELKKPLTTHIGRHTFGSILAEKTNDVLLIQKLMGIIKTETAMIYIKMTSKGAENKIKKIDW